MQVNKKLFVNMFSEYFNTNTGICKHMNSNPRSPTHRNRGKRTFGSKNLTTCMDVHRDWHHRIQRYKICSPKIKPHNYIFFSLRNRIVLGEKKQEKKEEKLQVDKSSTEETPGINSRNKKQKHSYNFIIAAF